MSTFTRVCIVGESPLVEEYASHCLDKQIRTDVRLNAQGKAHSDFQRVLPKGVRKIIKPAKNTDIAIELTNTSMVQKKANLVALDKNLSAKTLILSSSVTVTVAEQCTWLVHPERLIGLGALPSLVQGTLLEIAALPISNEATIASARAFVTLLGKEHALVQDSVGMVMPRILCMLANEAFFAIMEGVAVGSEIDIAMKLGTNYPLGPVEWAEKIGFRQVLAVVEALHKTMGEDRYRPAPLLQHVAHLNTLSMKHMHNIPVGSSTNRGVL
jgi:3-hydroxybutyryl-CoA dehydrogenase